ncbi:hypothetical protein ES703_89663 [subsurface metagenome]
MNPAANGERLRVALGERGHQGQMGEGVCHYREGRHIGATFLEEGDKFLLSHIAHEVKELAFMSPLSQRGNQRGDPQMEGPHNPVAGIDVDKGNFHSFRTPRSAPLPLRSPLLRPVAPLPLQDKLKGEAVK